MDVAFVYAAVGGLDMGDCYYGLASAMEGVEKIMPRKIFHETKMQGGNIYRPSKGKENIVALLRRKQAQKGRVK